MSISRIDGVEGPLAFYRFRVPGNAEHEYPVLVLGHALGVDHTMWNDVLPLLPAGLEILLWDQPGHGGSQLLDIETDAAASVAPTADVLHDVLNGLGLVGGHASRPIIAGLSLGGTVSLAFAERYPDALSGLVMFSSGAVLLPHQMWVERAVKVRSEGQGFLADSTMERWFSEAFRSGKGKGAVARTRNTFLGTKPEGYAQCCQLIAGTDLRSDTHKVRVPTMLVVGEDDPGMTPEQATQLAAEVTDSAVQVIDGVKHMTAVEQPQIVADMLAQFVARAS